MARATKLIQFNIKKIQNKRLVLIRESQLIMEK